MKTVRNIKKIRLKGFTLIEMIIALSLFVLTVLIATSAYLTINNTQRKTASMQRVQDDVRYLFEAIAQEVRLGKINYDYYTDNNIDLYPIAASPNFILSLRNQSDSQIFFRRSSQVPNVNNGLGDKVQYCEIVNAATDFCRVDQDSDWQDVTPSGVSLLDLKFIITPSADPFAESTPVPCTAGTGKTGECQNVLGYSCPAAASPSNCQYFSDNHSFQPKVRIVLKARAQNLGVSDKAEINIQSTVSSRIMPSKVTNLNFD